MEAVFFSRLWPLFTIIFPSDFCYLLPGYLFFLRLLWPQYVRGLRERRNISDWTQQTGPAKKEQRCKGNRSNTISCCVCVYVTGQSLPRRPLWWWVIFCGAIGHWGILLIHTHAHFLSLSPSRNQHPALVSMYRAQLRAIEHRLMRVNIKKKKKQNYWI